MRLTVRKKYGQIKEGLDIVNNYIQTQPALSANSLTNQALPAGSELHSHSLYQLCPLHQSILSDLKFWAALATKYNVNVNM